MQPSDFKKHYKHHVFDVDKAPNYMYIFEVGALYRVQITCKIIEFTHAKKNVPTTITITLKYWIWLNVDREDHRV